MTCEENFGFFQAILPPADEVWGKVMFSEASVILSTGGGVWPTPLPDADPLDADPPDADPPGCRPPHGILRNMVNKRAVRILL